MALEWFASGWMTCSDSWERPRSSGPATSSNSGATSGTRPNASGSDGNKRAAASHTHLSLTTFG
eukprot:3369066-Lingulodinium_polyedra.AAC.1